MCKVRAMSLFKIVLLVACFVGASGHEVATSSQSMMSGEGWRYSYGIAHGPYGIGHSVGESFPHGYGGFGTYAPSYGYHHTPKYGLPLHPDVINVPYEFISPQYYSPPVVYSRPRPIAVRRPYFVYPSPHYHNYYEGYDYHH